MIPISKKSHSKLILYSDNLNESDHTNTILLDSQYFFNLIYKPVNTGEKFLSVTAYSTFETQLIKSFASTFNMLVLSTSGIATYSLADIHLILKLSLAVLIVIVSLELSIINCISSSSISLTISVKVLAFIVIAHSLSIDTGIST
jgi:hypothetical protein